MGQYREKTYSHRNRWLFTSVSRRTILKVLYTSHHSSEPTMYQGLKMVEQHCENYYITSYGLNVCLPIISFIESYLVHLLSISWTHHFSPIPLPPSLYKVAFSLSLDFKSLLALSLIFPHLYSCPLQSSLHSAARRNVLKHKSDPITALFKVVQTLPLHLN